MKYSKEQIVWILLRFALGFTLLWAFLDKTFGLGRATAPDKSWMAGGSPTAGFLKNAVQGPLADFYHSLAGNPVVDWLFMLGLLLIGLALILDEHVIYLLVFLGFTSVKAGHWFGFGKWWTNTELVKKYPFLE